MKPSGTATQQLADGITIQLDRIQQVTEKTFRSFNHLKPFFQICVVKSGDASLQLPGRLFCKGGGRLCCFLLDASQSLLCMCWRFRSFLLDYFQINSQICPIRSQWKRHSVANAHVWRGVSKRQLPRISRRSLAQQRATSLIMKLAHEACRHGVYVRLSASCLRLMYGMSVFAMNPFSQIAGSPTRVQLPTSDGSCRHAASAKSMTWKHGLCRTADSKSLGWPLTRLCTSLDCLKSKKIWSHRFFTAAKKTKGQKNDYLH